MTNEDMKIRFTHYSEDGSEIEIELPGEYVVCSNCRGKGTHVNRAIDGNGLSAQDFADDPDFERDYFNGVYDVPCDDCHGKRVMLAVDHAQADPSDLKKYYVMQQDEAAYQAECDFERRMGC
jgi:hypothetical protein